MKNLKTVEDLVAIAINEDGLFTQASQAQAVVALTLAPQSHKHPALVQFARALLTEGGSLAFLWPEIRVFLQDWLIKNLSWEQTTIEGGPLSSEGNGGAQ